MSDDEMLRSIEGILASWRDGHVSEEQTIEDLICLYENAGRIFVTRIDGEQ
jgi:hypothetical protein